MKCTLIGCPGDYEDRRVARTYRQPDGSLLLIDGVPAEVCSHCGDVLLRPETVQRLEAIRRAPGTPARTAPVLEYAA